jgi:3-hydroxybutyrate dehydrogenase
MNVLITGSTSGIGLGIARVFAKAGYNIAFNGLENDGAEIAAKIGIEFKIKTCYSNANLLYPEQIKTMINEAEKKLGTIHVLINNAGIQHVCEIENFPEEKWEAIIKINLSSVFYTTKFLMKQMKENKFGRIINIASAHGLVASEFKGAYVAAKHGVVGFTKVTALEGAPYNVTCNAICPGYVKTPLVEKQIADQAKTHGITEDEVVNKIMLAKQPVKDFVSVEEIGNLALFLANEKSKLITGTALPIDGGWLAQ